MDADLGIGDHQQQVGFLDGLLHLSADLEIHREARILPQPARVHQPELAAVPLGQRKMAVARGPRLFADNGLLEADDAIEQL